MGSHSQVTVRRNVLILSLSAQAAAKLRWLHFPSLMDKLLVEQYLFFNKTIIVKITLEEVLKALSMYFEAFSIDLTLQLHYMSSVTAILCEGTYMQRAFNYLLIIAQHTCLPCIQQTFLWFL